VLRENFRRAEIRSQNSGGGGFGLAGDGGALAGLLAKPQILANGLAIRPVLRVQEAGGGQNLGPLGEPNALNG